MGGSKIRFSVHVTAAIASPGQIVSIGRSKTNIRYS